MLCFTFEGPLTCEYGSHVFRAELKTARILTPTARSNLVKFCLARITQYVLCPSRLGPSGFPPPSFLSFPGLLLKSLPYLAFTFDVPQTCQPAMTAGRWSPQYDSMLVSALSIFNFPPRPRPPPPPPHPVCPLLRNQVATANVTLRTRRSACEIGDAGAKELALSLPSLPALLELYLE